MPSFNFTVVEKETKVAKRKSVGNKSEILSKNIYGVVFIDIEGNYTVMVNGKHFIIHPDNYNTQGVSMIYLQRLSVDGQREIVARPLDFAPRLDGKHYLPFTVGCEVLGNIIKNKLSNQICFDILKVEPYCNNIDSKEAIQFYKDNYETIQKNRGLKWKTE